ncbi:MAG: GNAT family N-acetyltransferase [bacterium]
MHSIEPLDASHDREGFDCGSEALNAYLKQTARQHEKRGISRTFVLVEEETIDPKPILGFFTLNICQIKSDTLSPEDAKRLPRDVSGVKLGRLAVGRHFQKKGIGKYLLVGAMNKFLEIFHRAGGIGLFVDAKDETAMHYYEQFGFIPLPSNPLELFLPLKTIQKAMEK